MRIRGMSAIAGLGLAAVALLGGCGSSGQESTAVETPEGIDSEQVLTDYFTPFAGHDPAEMEAMLEVAVADSPAYLYAEHQINSSLADEAANALPEPDQLEVTADEVTITTSGLAEDATEEEVAEATTVYRDFQYSPDGKLVTWNSEPGGPLEPRILAQSGSGRSGGVRIEAQTSYETNNGDLVVTYVVRNKSKYDATVYPQGYVTPQGRQVKVATSSGSLELAPRTFATESAYVSNGTPGGKLRFEGNLDSPTYTQFKITVPVSEG